MRYVTRSMLSAACVITCLYSGAQTTDNLDTASFTLLPLPSKVEEDGAPLRTPSLAGDLDATTVSAPSVKQPKYTGEL